MGEVYLTPTSCLLGGPLLPIHKVPLDPNPITSHLPPCAEAASVRRRPVVEPTAPSQTCLYYGGPQRRGFDVRILSPQLRDIGPEAQRPQ